MPWTKVSPGSVTKRATAVEAYTLNGLVWPAGNAASQTPPWALEPEQVPAVAAVITVPLVLVTKVIAPGKTPFASDPLTGRA